MSTALSDGIALLARGRLTRAREIFQEAIDRNPKNAVALSYLGLAEAMAGSDFGSAEEKCFRATMMAIKDAQLHANLARVLLLADNRKGAVESVEEALACDPRNEDARRLQERLGKRRAPAIGSLPRSSTVNRVLGRMRRRAVPGTA